MVKLSYAFKLRASFEQVWAYFSHFENIVEYDPCVKSATVLNEAKNQIGTKYNIVTQHHGKEGRMTYELVKYSEQREGNMRNFMIQVYGMNDKIQSSDAIIVRETSKNPNDFNVVLEYKADLGLRGIYFLGTVFMVSTFKQIAQNAQSKCKLKCIEKWGAENVRNVEDY